MKKKSVLVFGASSDKLFAVGTFLISLRKKMPDFTDDIIVFYDEISEEDRRKLLSFKNLQLRRYECPFSNVDGLTYYVRELYTLMVYSKYECFRLLSEYECVIWMDYDMFVLDELYELLTPVREGVRAIVTERITDSLAEEFMPDGRINGIHSSVFALYDTLKCPEEIYDYCIRRTVELNQVLRCPEQAVMSFAMHDFDIAVSPLDFRIYSNPMTSDNIYDRYIKIYHTFGNLKFWNGIDYEPWNICKKEWEEI